MGRLSTMFLTVVWPLLLLMPAVLHQDKPAGHARIEGRASDLEEVSPCHGPRYYEKYQKLKVAARDKIARQKAQVEIERFGTQVGSMLHGAMEMERQVSYERLLREYRECLVRSRKPSLLCTAMAEARTDLCKEFSGPAEQVPCLQLVGMVAAIRLGDSGRCALLEVADIQRVCEFAVAREFKCDLLAKGPVRTVCDLIASDLDGAPVPGDLAEELRSPVFWLLALLRKEPGLCKRIGDAGEEAACVAALTGDTGGCPPVRHTIEHVDNDYSCRHVVAYEQLHTTGYGFEVVVGLAAPYAGTADCVVTLKRLHGKDVITQKLDTVAVGGGAGWTELRRQFGPGRMLGLSTECTWDPETSRFVLDEKTSRVW